MRVNPDVLHAFAGQVTTASELIAVADVGEKMSGAADQLGGSTTQWAARLVGAHLGAEATKIAKGVSDIGLAVRGAGNRYEVSDDDLAGRFTGLFN